MNSIGTAISVNPVQCHGPDPRDRIEVEIPGGGTLCVFAAHGAIKCGSRVAVRRPFGPTGPSHLA